VRKIVRLEARARRQLVRYDRTLAEATGAMAKARRLLDDAYVLEHTLTGTQLTELRRARAETLGFKSTPKSDSSAQSSMNATT
jgi:hypothetical protein